jgi:hypothetical protein
MNKFLSLKKRVMARIYIEYTKNLVTRHPDYFMLGVFAVTSFLLVSTRDVLNNIPRNNLLGDFNFFIIAIRDTSWIIQIFIAGFFVRAIVGGFILVHKNFSNKWSLSRFRVFKY